ncbi:hypothetical protein [Agromyces badenianii]|uniref:hypothetical protein n=1 Tax=Agromyces badenianii TaxID=2080742 RepID=UPI0010595E56|nr:hypothetical protein [Agromyces badenianii]
MNPNISAVVRTLTAYIVGAIVAGFTLANIHVPDEGAAALTGFLVIVLANAYYLLITLLARIWPGVGYLLIIPSEPSYGAGHDLLWAFLRTLIPSAIGWALSLIPQSLIIIDPATQTTLIVAITASTQGIYFAVLKWAETKVSWLSILLGGKPSAQPAYAPRHAA